MSQQSSNLGLTYLAAAQAQKHVTVNEALRKLDALVQLAVASATTSAQPGSPSDGQAYILPTGKTGAAWGAMANLAIAYYVDGAWQEITPREGWLAWVKDTDTQLIYSGSAWATLNYLTGTRERLSANRTYYVRTDGSDSNAGLTNSAGGAFLTIQKAVDTIAETLDISGKTVTIQIADGTYAGNVALKNVSGYGAAGSLVIKGNETTPANVVLSASSGHVFLANFCNVIWDVLGVKVTSAGGDGFQVLGAGSGIRVGAVDFGACTGLHMRALDGALLRQLSAYTISGDAAEHVRSATGSIVRLETGGVTLTGTRAFTTYGVALRLGLLVFAGAFSGSATGKRYDVTGNGVIDSNAGGATYLPGDVAGAAATGGQYV